MMGFVRLSRVQECFRVIRGSACATAAIRGMGVVACFDSGKVRGEWLHRRMRCKEPCSLFRDTGWEWLGGLRGLHCVEECQNHGRTIHT
jgi:hypothetical protein